MKFETCEKNGDGLTDESAIGDRDEALMGTVTPHSLSFAKDFSRVQEDSNAESLKEFCDEVEVEGVLRDDRPNHSTSATVNKGEFEEVQHDNRENCRKFEGAAG